MKSWYDFSQIEFAKVFNKGVLKGSLRNSKGRDKEVRSEKERERSEL